MTMQGSDEPWRLLDNATWRAGYNQGARYPSVMLTFKAEALDAAEIAALSECFLDILPAAPAMSAQTNSNVRMRGSGLAGVAELLLRMTNQIQRAAGLPVYEAGWTLSVAEDEARVLVPTVQGSYQLVADVMQWLVRACGMLRRKEDLAQHKQVLVALLQNLHNDFAFHSVSHQFMIAALDRGIPVAELPTQAVQFGQGHLTRRMKGSLTDETSSLSVYFGRLKQEAASVLRDAGIPVPDHYLVSDREMAVNAAGLLGYPVVVKPGDLDGGTAVGADLRAPDEVRSAFDTAFEASKNVLVEKHVPGRDYRITVYRDKVIWAIERVPGGVTGDGQSSIGQLIDALNANPARLQGPHSALKPLVFDEEARLLLLRDGFTEHSIPAAGQFIRLRRAANIAGGGLPVPALDQMHPDNARLAVRAAAAIGADIAGIDLLIPDIAVSWLESGAYVCEINPGPDLGQTTAAHLYGPILTSLVEGTGRIPIVLVAGAEPGSSLASLSAESLGLEDMIIGWHDARGVLIGNEQMAREAMQSYFAGRTLISDRRVEAIVMQVNDDDLVKTCLPFPRYDILVLAGESFAAKDPDHTRSAEAIAAELIPSMLPACDGTIILAPEAGTPPEDFRAMTPAQWRSDIAPDKVSAFLGKEIRRLASAHRRSLAPVHRPD